MRLRKSVMVSHLIAASPHDAVDDGLADSEAARQVAQGRGAVLGADAAHVGVAEFAGGVRGV